MQAPVYRNADRPNTFLGLAFPLEVLLLAGLFWPAMLLGPAAGGVITLAGYVGLRLLSHGRTESFVQHWLMRAGRRALYGGRLSAAARSREPAFPFGPYQIRQSPPKARE